MDRSKHQEERNQFRGIFQTSFPDLGEEYEILEPSTARYNCIAHSLGINDSWVQPETGSADAPLSFMDTLYLEQGFQRVPEMTFALDSGYVKVVLYALTADDGTIKEVTHAAVQDPSGTWESKVGQGPLIRHPTPESLNGPVYGEPVAVYLMNR